METANGMPYRLHRPPPPPSVQAYLLSLISSLKSQQMSQVGALPILSLHGDGGATYIRAHKCSWNKVTTMLNHWICVLLHRLRRCTFERKKFYYFLLRSENTQKMFSNLFASRRETHAKLISFRFVMLQSTKKFEAKPAHPLGITPVNQRQTKYCQQLYYWSKKVFGFSSLRNAHAHVYYILTYAVTTHKHTIVNWPKWRCKFYLKGKA